MKSAESISSSSSDNDASSSDDDDPPVPVDTPHHTNRQLEFTSPPTEAVLEELAHLVVLASQTELENIALKRTSTRLKKELLEAKQKKTVKRLDNKTSVNQSFKEEITEVVEDFF
eukprot:scaffold334073_cov48-Attheya_sp.AAC.2